MESGKEFDWLIGKVPLLGKLKHLDRVVLMGKVMLNAFLSLIMAGVIVNGIIAKHQLFLPSLPEQPADL